MLQLKLIGFLIQALLCTALRHDHHSYMHHQMNDNPTDLSLWINENQVKIFSGFFMKIYAIDNGKISPAILDPNFNQYLPVIPSEVNNVNFTWAAGNKKYHYNFDRLQSWDEKILKSPTISIKTKGKIPKEPKQFSVNLPCDGSGIAMFSIGLLIQTRKGKPIPGTPLRLNLKKECSVRDNQYAKLTTFPQGVCAGNYECKNGGWCISNDQEQGSSNWNGCQCAEGYMGQFCETALCFPNCMNSGNCTAPQVCKCPKGFQGRHCEGGICAEKCLNGGKCIQKDKCQCSNGYYGLRCEFSKCVIPCQNGGKCRGKNLCRCPPGLGGDHCEIGRHQRSTCKKPCKHGNCLSEEGFVKNCEGGKKKKQKHLS